ncbi:MAG TPA: isopentenyl-diphosphate Delta-isomerase [archaeon]|jgi:isopentenyl-diphosphate delta-isomerase|nr:isopentenyl-diphosphate Delta-isomerase [archaeon]
MVMEKIIIVDEKDRQTGTGEKLDVHKKGRLHRAFSIFVFNPKEELLLQKRAAGKYHSPGLWANTCCSHPRAGESLEDAVHRRLKEEMGFDVPLREIFSFMYKVKFGNGLTENEYDHVFAGSFEGKPEPDPEEVGEWKWISLEDLKGDVKRRPERYTYWLRVSLDRLVSHMNGLKK